MKNKFKIATLLFFTTSFTLGACSDWTDIEGIDIKQPNIQEQNPELYTKYLENLRQYKADTEHKKVLRIWISVFTVGLRCKRDTVTKSI